MRKFYSLLAASLFVTVATLSAQPAQLGANTKPLPRNVARAVKNAKSAQLRNHLTTGASATALLTNRHLFSTNATAADATDAQKLITTPPTGTVYSNLYHSGSGFTQLWGYTYEIANDGLADDVVFTDNGEVYIKNPLTTLWTNTYIKGVRTVGDTIAVQLPQFVYHQDAEEEGDAEDMYLYKLQLETNDDGESTFRPIEGDQVMKYVWRNDSLIMVNDTQSSFLLGACDAEGGWYGYGDYISTYSVFNEQPVVPKNAADAQGYAFNYVGDGVEDGRVVKTVFEDGNVYIAGVAPNQPEAWIKGEIKEDSAHFAGKQYLGIDTTTESHTFFMPLGERQVWVEDWEDYDVEYYFHDSLPMAYDADAKTLSTDSTFVVNQGYLQVNQQATYAEMTFVPREDRAATPSDPEIYDFTDYDEEYGMGMLTFILSKYADDGYLMDDQYLYYNIYFDDEVVTFQPDEYIYLENEITNIPYTYSDRYDFSNAQGMFYVSLYSTGFDKIGVQLVYTGGGETHKSNIVYYTLDDAAVHGVTTSSVLSTTYTDLSGRRVANPGRGAYIRTQRMADGSLNSVKIIKK